MSVNGAFHPAPSSLVQPVSVQPTRVLSQEDCESCESLSEAWFRVFANGWEWDHLVGKLWAFVKWE